MCLKLEIIFYCLLLTKEKYIPSSQDEESMQDYDLSGCYLTSVSWNFADHNLTFVVAKWIHKSHTCSHSTKLPFQMGLKTCFRASASHQSIKYIYFYFKNEPRFYMKYGRVLLIMVCCAMTINGQA